MSGDEDKVELNWNYLDRNVKQEQAGMADRFTDQSLVVQREATDSMSRNNWQNTEFE